MRFWRRAHLGADEQLLLFGADEMIRVFMKGRKNRRAAVCFVGYPRLDRRTLTLLGTDGQPNAVVRRRDIIAVQRVRWPRAA